MTKILGVQQSLALNLHGILDRLKEPALPSTETELPNAIHGGTDTIKSKRFGSVNPAVSFDDFLWGFICF